MEGVQIVSQMKEKKDRIKKTISRNADSSSSSSDSDEPGSDMFQKTKFASYE